MHHLVLLLGTGSLRERATPPSKLVRTRAYRTAPYHLAAGTSDGTSEIVETPFVGKAIVRLFPAGTFDRVHLLGTGDSMWDTLALHVPPRDEDYYLTMAEAVASGAVGEDGERHPLMVRLQDLLSDWLGVPTQLGVLPLPDSADATWAMFRRMASLDGLAPGDSVSIDMTHGLRVQPLFLLLAARYLQAVEHGVSLRHVLYGAFDLRTELGVPIYDLREHVALLDWIDAARSFSLYTDAEPAAALIDAAGVDGGAEASGALRAFSRHIQANAASDIGRSARDVVRALGDLDATVSPPLDLMRSSLEALPGAVLSGAEWERLLTLARHHWEHGRAALAVMAAYEAAVARVGDLYGVVVTNHDNHKRAGYALRRITHPSPRGSAPHYPFRQLVRWRNGLAHTRTSRQEHSFQITTVYHNFGNTLSMLERELADGGLIRSLRDRVNFHEL